MFPIIGRESPHLRKHVFFCSKLPGKRRFEVLLPFQKMALTWGGNSTETQSGFLACYSKTELDDESINDQQLKSNEIQYINQLQNSIQVLNEKKQSRKKSNGLAGCSRKKVVEK